jgi:hypothetical protein
MFTVSTRKYQIINNHCTFEPTTSTNLINFIRPAPLQWGDPLPGPVRSRLRSLEREAEDIIWGWGGGGEVEHCVLRFTAEGEAYTAQWGKGVQQTVLHTEWQWPLSSVHSIMM